MSLHSWKSRGSGESTSTLQFKTKTILRFPFPSHHKCLFESVCAFCLLLYVLAKGSYLGARDTSISRLARSAIVTLSINKIHFTT